MPYYAMFTEIGNEAIDGLVGVAKALELEWNEVEKALSVLADNPKFSEATDTAVREAVYSAMGFDKE